MSGLRKKKCLLETHPRKHTICYGINGEKMLSWIAGTFELIGLWKVGNKSKLGFVFNGVCCVLWITHVSMTWESPGLLVVVVPAFFINIRNYIKWTREAKIKKEN